MIKKTSESESTYFIDDRNTIRDFITRMRRIIYLAEISGVSKSTVERTFKVENFESLSGSMLTVWENALKIYDDFQQLKNKTRAVAKSIRESEKKVSVQKE